MLRQQRIALLLMLLLLPPPLKLLVQPLIVHLRQLLLHRALLIAQCQPQQNHKPAAKPTAKAWNVCSRNRCLNKIVLVALDYKSFIQTPRLSRRFLC
jgi:hypothetical protein